MKRFLLLALLAPLTLSACSRTEEKTPQHIAELKVSVDAVATATSRYYSTHGNLPSTLRQEGDKLVTRDLEVQVGKGKLQWYQALGDKSYRFCSTYGDEHVLGSHEGDKTSLNYSFGACPAM